MKINLFICHEFCQHSLHPSKRDSIDRILSSVPSSALSRATVYSVSSSIFCSSLEEDMSLSGSSLREI